MYKVDFHYRDGSTCSYKNIISIAADTGYELKEIRENEFLKKGLSFEYARFFLKSETSVYSVSCTDLRSIDASKEL